MSSSKVKVAGSSRVAMTWSFVLKVWELLKWMRFKSRSRSNLSFLSGELIGQEYFRFNFDVLTRLVIFVDIFPALPF